MNKKNLKKKLLLYSLLLGVSTSNLTGCTIFQKPMVSESIDNDIDSFNIDKMFVIKTNNSDIAKSAYLVEKIDLNRIYDYKDVNKYINYYIEGRENKFNTTLYIDVFSKEIVSIKYERGSLFDDDIIKYDINEIVDEKGAKDVVIEYLGNDSKYDRDVLEEMIDDIRCEILEEREYVK